MSARQVVLIPLSRTPIEYCEGLFVGTLAFPVEPKKAKKFADAWWREAIRLTAIDDDIFAETPHPWPPRLLRMRDSEAERLLREGEKAFFRRKQAYFAEQALFAEALNEVTITHLAGLGDLMRNTAENRYVKTNIWLNKAAGASTKPLIRDAITPSKPVIHAVVALWARAVFEPVESRGIPESGEF